MSIRGSESPLGPSERQHVHTPLQFSEYIAIFEGYKIYAHLPDKEEMYSFATKGGKKRVGDMKMCIIRCRSKQGVWLSLRSAQEWLVPCSWPSCVACNLITPQLPLVVSNGYGGVRTTIFLLP